MPLKLKPKLTAILSLSIVLLAGTAFLIHNSRSAYTLEIDANYSPTINVTYTPETDVIYTPATDVYEFPITPDKTPDEWKKLKDYSERLASSKFLRMSWQPYLPKDYLKPA